MFISLVIGIGIGLLATALVISVAYLTTSIIKSRVSSEIPEAAYVIIHKSFENKGVTILPKYKAKAYNRNHEKIRDIEFIYDESEYFYDGEKIAV